MRLPSIRPANAVLLSSMLFPSLIVAVGNLDCHKIVTDGKVWDLSKIGGPRSVMESHETPPTWHNTTYTIDICKNLRRFDDVPDGEKCFGGTRVCAIGHTIKTIDGTDEVQDDVTEVISIAGDLADAGGGYLDAKYTRLSTSELPEDSEKEGLRIVLNGGFYGNPKRKQQAVVEFLCDPNRTGTETDLDPEDKYEGGEENPTEGISSLKFKGYDKNPLDPKVDTLWLEWYTKYACEGQKDEDDAATSRHWGFFTWFLIIGFLVTAAYLIFGSWLNYNRYGARGWDLLPHGDTIRDVPYLLKDWTRRVVNTVQGSGSRGGYSAV